MTFHVRVWKESVHKWHLWQIGFQVLILINVIGIQIACSLSAFNRLSFGFIKTQFQHHVFISNLFHSYSRYSEKTLKTYNNICSHTNSSCLQLHISPLFFCYCKMNRSWFLSYLNKPHRRHNKYRSLNPFHIHKFSARLTLPHLVTYFCGLLN